VPDIRPATEADLPAIGRAMAAAFADDPVWMWLASPKADWDRRAPAWFETEARCQLRGHGDVLVDDEGRGAAIWAPPHRWRSGLGEGVQLAIPSLRLFRSRLPRSLRALQHIERHHAREPHWYLAIIGTDPRYQGLGIGSALIRAVTDRCDEEGLGAYLESSKEENVPFYARHGFKVTRQLAVGGGPPMWLMWRDPR
jgi:GNAT superfamily N-acetyltransferase